MGNKEMISYYDMGGESARMYREIDNFLELSKRFSPQAVKRKRIIGSALLWGATALMLAIIIAGAVMDPMAGFTNAATLGVFMLGTIGGGVYFSFFYGKKPFIEVVRTDAIIDRDGLENVYNDLKHAVQIPDTPAYLGDEYLFMRGKVMCRIRDISDVYIRVVSDDDSTTYYASVRVYDETGNTILDLTTLKGFLAKKRQENFEKIKQPIEAKRQRLLKLSDTVDDI